MTDASGETRTAADWVGPSGRARKLRAARVLGAHAWQVGAVVCVHAREMKRPWCLAASEPDAPAATPLRQYARRWTIEPSFRDTKDLRFGIGMAKLRLAQPEQRDRQLKSNTSRTRTRSLFRQGCIPCEPIRTMPEHRLVSLIQRFNDKLAHGCLFRRLLPEAK